jgi:peptidoglycan/xylan/chitin deacetylase (PgdA/CDA1 family)
MKKPLERLIFRILALVIAVGGIALLQAGQVEPPSDHDHSQSMTQHGFTVALHKVEERGGGVQLFVSLENHGNEAVFFYDVNTEIWQGEKRYEPERVFDSLAELPSKVPPRSRAEGVILFPKLAREATEIMIRFPRPAKATRDEAWNPIEFRWPLPLPTASPADAVAPTVARSSVNSSRIIIIKADDFRAPSANWDRFIEVSAKRRIKVSIGIICESLRGGDAGYSAWLRSRQNSGEVEFWSHGWDHQRLGGGRAVSEYGGSGYAYQKKHLTDSQEIMRKVLGKPPVALGTPWNEFDYDTVQVVNEDQNVRLFFGHKEGVFGAGKIVVRMLQAEANGTGNPDFSKFKTLYESHKTLPSVIALQFHPPVFQERSFIEYERMLDFLIQEGWTFLLPQEYLDRLDGKFATTATVSDPRRNHERVQLF